MTIRKKKKKKVVKTSVARKKKTKKSKEATKRAITLAMARVLESHDWTIDITTTTVCTICDEDAYDDSQNFCGECGSAIETRYSDTEDDECAAQLWEAYQAAKKLDK